MTKLIIIRGLPGSGKTTIAKKMLVNECEGYSHYEADMFFEDEEGNYVFDHNLLKKAHAWCKGCTRLDLQNGKSVIVSNTFTQMWEMKPYIEMAEGFGIEYEVIEVSGEYGSIHGVPDEVIQKMKERWEPYKG